MKFTNSILYKELTEEASFLRVYLILYLARKYEFLRVYPDI